ncbi:GM16992 [Drosophila sechellia]|uniref:GM16992 n=1 Tax=Drosophila sechellia TaxID=7238 RepID=B4I5Z4_DROSE|nr:GM16992 [Drosophila sechellia]
MQVKMFIKKELSTLEEISVMEELLLLGEIPVKEEKEDSMPDAISVKKEPKEQDSDKQQHDVLNRNEGTTPICCAPTCLHHENSQYRFFCFPSYENTLIQWLVNTQMKPSLVNPFDLYIFHFHFEPEAVQRTQHLRSAVPTLFLGHEEYLKESESICKKRYRGTVKDSG